MTDSAQLAESFFEAWTGKDFDRARSLLHDDVSFTGPIDTFDSADDYIASLRQLAASLPAPTSRRCSSVAMTCA
jgi:hypothetical protein